MLYPDSLADIALISFGSSDNPSPGDVERNSQTNALIEDWLEGTGGVSSDDVLSLVEGYGLDADAYCDAFLDSVAFGVSGGGILVPQW